MRAACERFHPGLNRAFLEAGLPWLNVSRCSIFASLVTACAEAVGPVSKPASLARGVQRQLGRGRSPLHVTYSPSCCSPLQGSINGAPETIRRALKAKGHERLMRVIYLLTGASHPASLAGMGGQHGRKRHRLCAAGSSCVKALA